MIRILDSTLREGEQSPGVYFPLPAKLRIANLLDQVGVDIIEAGNPSVDPKIAEAVKAIAQAGLKARIGAHARCRSADVEKAIACGPGFLGVFLGVSEQRLERDYKISFSQALENVRSVISDARKTSAEMQIRFTIEDAIRTPSTYIIETALAATEAGADILSLADTTGFASPFDKERSIGQMVRKLRDELALRNFSPEIEVHCHNDRGLALVNVLDAYRNGAAIIDATVLGLGERAGIADLAELLVSLRETFGEGAHWNFSSLATLYEVVSKEANIPIPANRPIVGRHAFTHSAGIHVNALAQDPASYQSLRPELFGRALEFTLGMQSGRASVEQALAAIGREDVAKDGACVSQILSEVKERASEGLPVSLHDEFPALVKRVVG